MLNLMDDIDLSGGEKYSVMTDNKPPLICCLVRTRSSLWTLGGVSDFLPSCPHYQCEIQYIPLPALPVILCYGGKTVLVLLFDLYFLNGRL